MDSYLTETKFYEIIDSIKDLIYTFEPILFLQVPPKILANNHQGLKLKLPDSQKIYFQLHTNCLLFLFLWIFVLFKS